ncbi:MAG: pimeloyl-ACP methyl ester esterase BioH [Steroidobacteraceae bacterium]
MRLHGETLGAGPPLVLLHGWAMNLGVFDALAAALAPHHTVTRLDLPGHGRSPWREGLGADAAADWLLESLPERATLVGWSLGGQLALRMAARAPARIARLVLLASTPRFLATADWPHGLAAAALQGVAAGLARDPARTLEEFLELQVRGGAGAEAALATLHGALATHGAARPQALAAGLDWLAAGDLRQLAPALALPVLLVNGQNDRVTPPDAARAFAGLLPRARLVELRRAAHVPFLSHPAAVLAALQEFLAPAASGAAA